MSLEKTLKLKYKQGAECMSVLGIEDEPEGLKQSNYVRYISLEEQKKNKLIQALQKEKGCLVKIMVESSDKDHKTILIGEITGIDHCIEIIEKMI